MRLLAAAGLLLAFSPAHADIFRCEKDGKMVFQQAPCPDGSESKQLMRSAGNDLPWTGLEFGMPLAQARGKLTGAHEERGRVPTLVRTSTLAGYDFEWRYKFANGVLSWVGAGDPSMMNLNQDSIRKFEKLFALFSARYGQEDKRELKQQSWGVSADADWTVGGNQLSLTISPLTADTSWVIINYRPTGARRAD